MKLSKIYFSSMFTVLKVKRLTQKKAITPGLPDELENKNVCKLERKQITYGTHNELVISQAHLDTNISGYTVFNEK